MNAAIIIVIAWFLASLGAIALLSRAWSDLRKAKIRAIQLEIEIGGMKSAVRDLELELGCAKWMIRDALDTARVWLPELPEAALAAHSFESGACEYCGAAEHPSSHAGESVDDIEF